MKEDCKNNQLETEGSRPEDGKIVFIERPRICCIDLNKETLSKLTAAGHNIYSGTLGPKVRVPNISGRRGHDLLPNFDYPPNFHEFDIIIADLEGFQTVEYKKIDHSRESVTGNSFLYFLSSYPETLFDPRPLSSTILRTRINEITNRKYLVIVFSSKNYRVTYESIIVSDRITEKQKLEEYGIYNFLDFVPCADSKFGREVTIEKNRKDLRAILEKYKGNLYYNQTFHHPTKWEDERVVKDDRYTPLMRNINGEIVSYLEIGEFRSLTVLPQIENKAGFILDFLSHVAPSICPELFPYSSSFSWKEENLYWLPNHEKLLKERINIQTEFKEKINLNEKLIELNRVKYSFLHDIISETGDSLVKALIEYFKWLQFKEILDYDEAKPHSGVLEEDIQIKVDEGLLIIECKGIGGTSSDSDCSQISKIKHRRSKERGKFDVYALYIVNHQRYLPPFKRQNPPFSKNQILDAESDERGLLSTWQLFKLYFEIERGILTKEEARKNLTDYGLVDFRPNGLIYLYEPTEIFKEGKVCIINIDEISLCVNDEIYVEKNGFFQIAKLLSIKRNEISVQQASDGELGIKLSVSVSKKSILWIKKKI